MTKDTSGIYDLTRPCTKCNGTTKSKYIPTHPCSCTRAGLDVPGVYPRVDLERLMRALVPQRGKNKGGIRASNPKYSWGDVEGCRAYYVWRWFRFHAGYDVTLPMNANLFSDGDPFVDELEKISMLLARRYAGAKVSQGAVRWGRVLGSISDKEMSELDHLLGSSAKESGPTHDENKPVEEWAEKR